MQSMQYYQNDKAIEFYGLYREIESILRNFKEAEIDVSKEEKRALDAKQSCEKGISSDTTQMEAETKYQDGINELTQVRKDLERHTVYYTSYYTASDVEEELARPKFDKEKITDFANITIELLNQIQTSDTRAYASEQAVVEKIYRLAYDVIKMELVIKGTSIVLDWVRNDDTASRHINSQIEIDILRLDEEGITNDIIRDTLHMIKTNDIVCSYLDEGLILFIAMQNEKTIEMVEASLLHLINDIMASDDQVKQAIVENNTIEAKIQELKNTIKKSNIYKELGLALSLIAVLAGLKYGSEKLATKIGHKEYRTKPTYFSTETGSIAPVYPEYMKKIDGFEQTTLVAYDVWRQENIFYGDYQRDIVTYDLSGIDLENLEEFLSYDFSDVKKSSVTETESKLNVYELYDKAIVEITRLVQDENDDKFVPNENGQQAFLITMTVVTIAIGVIGSAAILTSIIQKLKNRGQVKLLSKEEEEKWQKSLRHYQRLCRENKEYREKFIAQYQKFAQFIKDPRVGEECRRILTPNNNN